MESHWRSVAKAVTWRAGGTVVTFLSAWVILGTPGTAAKIGIFDTCLKIAAFYSHERVWNRLRFGKIEPPEYQI